MKVLLINGSPNGEGCTYTALKEISDTLNKENILTEFYQVPYDTKACKDCEACYHAGRCAIDDDVNIIAEKMKQTDGLIIGTPVYYAGINGSLKSFLDRLFYSADRETFAYKPAAAITSSRRAGNLTTFDIINKYFQISSMNIIGSDYWNGVHGNTPQEVLQDKEGLRTMRVLAHNMAYYLRLREAGKDVTLPPYEPKEHTNFIR